MWHSQLEDVSILENENLINYIALHYPSEYLFSKSIQYKHERN